MPGEAGQMLRALRVSRHWDIDRMARELHRASDEPVAAHHALVRMIRTWEDGEHAPRERYLLLYRRVFPGEWPANGPAPDFPPDPAAVLERARQSPGRAELAALQLAAFHAGRTDLVTIADKLLALQRQVDDLAEDLKRSLGEAGG